MFTLKKLTCRQKALVFFNNCVIFLNNNYLFSQFPPVDCFYKCKVRFIKVSLEIRLCSMMITAQVFKAYTNQCIMCRLITMPT